MTEHINAEWIRRLNDDCRKARLAEEATETYHELAHVVRDLSAAIARTEAAMKRSMKKKPRPKPKGGY